MVRKVILTIGFPSGKINEVAGKELPEIKNSRKEPDNSFLKSKVLFISDELAD